MKNLVFLLFAASFDSAVAASTSVTLGGAATSFLQPGEAIFVKPATYTWVVPTGVLSIHAVVIGAGGAGLGSNGTPYGAAGAGGSLRWQNNIPVTPGQSCTIRVGEGGNQQQGTASADSGESSFITCASGTLTADGGGGALNINSNGGGVAGSGATTISYVAGDFGGGNGGNGGGGNNSGSGGGGGGGAGGYTGDGGRGNTTNSGPGATAGVGGGGGGGSPYDASGGGVMFYGEGSSGNLGNPGQGGSLGFNGNSTSAPYQRFGGGFFGGGGAGSQNGGAAWSHRGGDGAVRLVWGVAALKFPSLIPTQIKDTCSSNSCLFVSSVTTNGNIGGLLAADMFCQNRANSAGLSGIWKAVLGSSSTSAASRLNLNYPVTLVNGHQVASTNLWISLQGQTASSYVGIALDEKGLLIPSGEYYYSGISSTNGSIRHPGNASNTCNDWMSSSDAYISHQGQYIYGDNGVYRGLFFYWDFSNANDCDQQRRLLCISTF